MARTFLSNRPLLATRSDAQLFTGRKAEVERILHAAERGYNTAVVGARGSGKTSLLHQVSRQLSETQSRLPVLCDGRAFRDRPLGFLWMLADGLEAAAAVESEETALSVRPMDMAMQEQALLGLLERRLSEVAASQGEAVFLIDNMGEPQSADFFRKTFSSLRDILWSLSALFVVTVDDSEEADLLRPPADSFFEIVVRLPDFKGGEISELLERRGVSSPQVAEIFKIAGGNPRGVLDLARRLEIGELQPGDLERLAVRTEPKEGESELETRVLRYLATRGSASASDPEFQAAMEVTRTRLAQVLSKLSSEGTIQGSRHGRKVYYSLSSVPAISPGDP
jgi:energy-coupling factor transporter ATP-binding protein EcfA2